MWWRRVEKIDWDRRYLTGYSTDHEVVRDLELCISHPVPLASVWIQIGQELLMPQARDSDLPQRAK